MGNYSPTPGLTVMHLSPHSLRQVDKAYLDSLAEVALRGLSVKLLEDWKEARERLNQGPENSARPPSSRAPWERQRGGRESDAEAEDGAREPEAAEAKAAEATSAGKAGKQPGAPGIGRTHVFQAHEEQAHYPAACAGGDQPLEPAAAVAYTGFQAVDRRWGKPAPPGLTLWVVDHRY